MAAKSARHTLLYLQNEALRSASTTVTAIQRVSALSEVDRALFKEATNEDYVVTTAESVFYVQGGGQPCDTGMMLPQDSTDLTKFEVSSVRHGSGGSIMHLGRFLPTSSRSFSVGERIEQTIDGAKRDLNSRFHTAGHIVGLAVRHLAESIPNVTELKAQHAPGSAFVEFRGLIDGKHKDDIQTKCDTFVQQALPIKIYWWGEDELSAKCAAVPENVKITQGELIRAVDIEGAGAYPCGGTHVPDTGLVGKLELRKISRQKGHSKISYSVS